MLRPASATSCLTVPGQSARFRRLVMFRLAAGLSGTQATVPTIPGSHRITSHLSRSRFAARLNSGVRPHMQQPSASTKQPLSYAVGATTLAAILGAGCGVLVAWIAPSDEFSWLGL